MKNLEHNLSEGSVVRQLLTFAVPFILSSLVQNLYSTVDLIVLGQFAGTASLAGASSASSYVTLITNIAIGFCSGGTVIIGQHLGGGRREEMKETIGTLCTFILILAAAFTVVSVVLGQPILTLMQTPAEARRDAYLYLMISAAGFLFIYGYNTLSAILRGVGDSTRPFLFVCVACVINVVLDLVLVGVFQMGAAGAAIATIFSQGISMVLCVIYLRRKQFVFDFRFSSFRIQKERLRQLVCIGIPSTILQSVTLLGYMITVIIVNTMGVTAAAAVASGQKVSLFAVLPALAVGNALSAVCAHNYGADKPERARKSMFVSLAVIYAVNIIMAVVLFVLARPLISVFSRDADVLAQGADYIRITSFDYLGMPFQCCFTGLLIGSGRTVFSAFINVFCTALRTTLSWVLGVAMGMGAVGVAVVIPIGSYVCMGICLVYFFRLDRCRNLKRKL